MSGTIHSTSSILWSLIHCSRLTDMRPDWAEEPALLWMTQPIEKSRGAPEGPLIGYFCHCQHCVCPSQWPRYIHRHCERSEAISSLRRFAAPMAGTRAERSEEHTSELHSLMRNSYAVFCLKKKII